MSQAGPITIIDLDAFDSSTLALARAIAVLHCVHTASDPANLNQPSKDLVLDALDAGIALVERARELLVAKRVLPGTVVEFPARH